MNLSNFTSFLKNSQLIPLQKGQETFVPIYKIYFDMLKGDIYACFVLGELMRLQNTPSSQQENDGWVVLTYRVIQEKYYMSKHVWDKSIKALKKIGLEAEMRPHPRYPDFQTGVWHYRVDEDKLLEAVVQYMSKGIEQSSDNSSSAPMASPNAGVDGGGSRETPSVGDLNKTVTIDTDTPIVVASAPKQTKASKPRSRVNTSSHYQDIFKCVSENIFHTPDNVPIEKGRIGLIASYLWGTNKSMKAPRPVSETQDEKVNNICKDVQEFVCWWGNKYPGLNLPLSLGKFAHHWLDFWRGRSEYYKYVDIDKLFTGHSSQLQSSQPLDPPSDMPKPGSAFQALFSG